jgi:arginyl-tRNA synthetase
MLYPIEAFEKEVKKLVKVSLSQFGYVDLEIKLETPSERLGDLAIPCFQFTPIFKKSPEEIATLLEKEIEDKVKKAGWIKKVEKKGAYLNFFIKEDRLAKETIAAILKMKNDYGKLPKSNKKVIIEHTSANPNGPLHVGRARNPIIGDSIVRIYKAAGYKVESQFYVDNIGKQVAILAWGVNNIDAKEVPKAKYSKLDHQLVGYYQTAYKLMDEKPEFAAEI